MLGDGQQNQWIAALGWAAIIIGFGVLLWGVTIDGRQWWRRKQKNQIREASTEDMNGKITRSDLLATASQLTGPTFPVATSEASLVPVATGVSMRGITARGNGGHGIYIGAGSTVTIDGADVSGNALGGIHIEGDDKEGSTDGDQ